MNDFGQRRVVILGAKPDAIVPMGDAVYCANSAIGFYADQVATFSDVVNVVSAGEILRKPRMANTDAFERKYRLILQARPARLVLLCAPGTMAAREQLAVDGYPVDRVELLSLPQRSTLIRQVSGLREPLFGPEFWSLRLSNRLKLIRFVAATWLAQLRGREVLHSSYLRINTGIMALLLAIREQGPEASYVLSGIGVSGRMHYPDGVVDPRPSMDGLPTHVMADVRMLRELGRRYRVASTDAELSERAGLTHLHA